MTGARCNTQSTIVSGWAPGPASIAAAGVGRRAGQKPRDSAPVRLAMFRAVPALPDDILCEHLDIPARIVEWSILAWTVRPGKKLSTALLWGVARGWNRGLFHGRLRFLHGLGQPFLPGSLKETEKSRERRIDSALE